MTSLALKASQRVVVLTEKHAHHPMTLAYQQVFCYCNTCMFKHFAPKFLFQILGHISITRLQTNC